MVLIKTIGIRDDDERIRDLFGLATIAKHEAAKMLRHNHFKVLPEVEYNLRLHIYTMFIQIDEEPKKQPSFAERMNKLEPSPIIES